MLCVFLKDSLLIHTGLKFEEMLRDERTCTALCARTQEVNDRGREVQYKGWQCLKHSLGVQ